MMDSLPRNTISSSYWKIPDSSSYLSAVAAHESDPLVAVASGSADSNLFIYELQRTKHNNKEKAILTHHQTITLPGIYSLAWASPKQSLGRHGNVLASGHKSGLMHLTLLPDPSSHNEPAEILRRFNHNKHVARNESCKSTRIRNLNIVSDRWACCAESSLLTLFNESIFLWDPARSDIPVLKKRCRGVTTVDASPLRDGIISLGGAKGISIMDLRVKDSPGLSPPEDNDTVVSRVKWSPHDENHIASIHAQNTVKIWDIRAGKPLVALEGHSDRINSIDWSPTDGNEFYSGSSDGTIRMWDINACVEFQNCLDEPVAPLKIAPSSPSGNNDIDWLAKPLSQHRKRMSMYGEIFSQGSYFKEATFERAQPFTTAYSQAKEFLALTPINLSKHSSTRVISIDTDGFFGLHTKQTSSTRKSTTPSLLRSQSSSSENESLRSDDELFSSAGSLASTTSSSPSLEDSIASIAKSYMHRYEI